MLTPPFQRRSAWTDKKASLYIESLLIGCPVPPITLAELPSTKSSNFQYVVIDGKQRLSSLKRFTVDETLVLSGLEVLPNLNGKTFSEINEFHEFSRFINLPVRTVILRNWKKDEVLQFVFHRLNTQATPLSTHELRRSLLAGKFTDYLDRRSAESKGIQRILGITEPDYRLRDAELLLRGIAFTTYAERYRGNLKQFLDTVTKQLNRSWGSQAIVDEVDRASDEIDSSISTVYKIFGNHAFQRLDDTGKYTGRFNRAVFDIMLYAFKFSDVQEAALLHKTEVEMCFRALNENPQFSEYVAATTKTPEAVLGRLGMWLEALEPVLGLGGLRDRTTVLLTR
ncbi:DUF262 domain-containing protein [Arthrobacter sp. ISL-5]|uniref:DUF262 domain-containing protein n=1 Tax=Arthrobacter sp. ISL-5 TaxID=2819111 RepID=UPI001BEA6B39|nr:DUF262 domain-containing protein [Arthrobacter sp. ISL-5]MBT2554466.1 DUF262 domain-containing protein [Arthrobacter sp. ISL-5]